MLDLGYDPPERYNNESSRKSLKWVLFDSFIVAVISFLAKLPADQIPDVIDLYQAFLAFANAFLLQIVIEYEIKPYVKRNRAHRKKRNE